MTMPPPPVRESGNLAGPLDWTRLLASLGPAEPTGVLPRMARCPLCRVVRLDVYQDTTNSGTWYRCRGCSFAGDGLQLAAAAWKIPLEAAYARLVEAGIAPPADAAALADYQERFPARRERGAQLWATAPGRLHRAPTLQRLRRLVGADGTPPDLWPVRGGQYLGAVGREALAAALDPLAIDRVMPQMARVGPPWEDALAVPLYDVPGRVAAFVLACRDGAGSDQVCLAVDPAARTHHYRYPAAVGMLDALLTTADETAIVFLDPLLAARLHVRQLAEGSAPLAVAAVWPAAPVAKILRTHAPGRRLVFWARRADADLFRHAGQLDADVIVDDVAATGPLDRLAQRPTRDWLRIELRKAKHWSVVLEHYLQDAPITEAESILSRIGLLPAVVKRFIAGCPVGLRERLAAAVPGWAPHRSVTVDGWSVVETAAGWHLEPGGRLITEAPFRIDEILHTPRASGVFYRGRILLAGREIPFLARDRDFAHHPLRWLAAHVLKRGHGAIRTGEGRQLHVIDIAMSFQAPRIIHDADDFGWRAAEDAWVFPTYAIAAGGAVVRHKRPAGKRQGSPAGGLRRPSLLDQSAVALLAEPTAVAATVWATVIGVVHNLLARRCGYATVGILATRAGPETGPPLALTVAGLLGCASRRHRTKQTWETQLADARCNTGWPVAHTGILWKSAPAAWLWRGPHNCLIPTDRLSARSVAAGSAGWWRLNSHGSTHGAAWLGPVLPQIIPAFLHWFERQPRLPLAAAAAVSPLTIANVLGRWFVEEGGTQRALERAFQAITPDTPAARGRGFISLAARLHQLAKLPLVWAGEEKDPAAAAIIYRSASREVWLPREGLSQALATCRALPFDPAGIAEVLAAAAPGARPSSYRDRDGWLVPELAWNAALRHLHCKTQG